MSFNENNERIERFSLYLRCIPLDNTKETKLNKTKSISKQQPCSAIIIVLFHYYIIIWINANKNKNVKIYKIKKLRICGLINNVPKPKNISLEYPLLVGYINIYYIILSNHCNY